MPDHTTYPAPVIHHPVPLHPTAHGAVIPAPPAALPGVASVQLPDGQIVTGYTLTPTPTTPARPAGSVPAWAKTTALLAPTVGGGVAAAGIGLSYAAPGLIAMSHALWSAAALLVATVIAVPLALRTVRRALTGDSSGAGGTSVRTTTHITQNITATGLFGRANGTINH
ncbi:hypothetical protein SNE510_16090 [Streptomyces sp. NE5-10]|uniref:hypothetical protein n=1 Tax=Streptomyces sp. NE5-10 TaxID=2759674 RepID=UPI001908BA7D|nr:hypothetical protein [Streptomyces sp. NE5-10]GHJ92090.1 hypothetical protein SNE510_16090 [Streptomyces sp. NE5-10]